MHSSHSPVSDVGIPGCHGNPSSANVHAAKVLIGRRQSRLLNDAGKRPRKDRLMSSSPAKIDFSTTQLFNLLGVLGLLILASIVLMARQTAPPPLPAGIPGTASDPADTWVKKPYVPTGQAPIPLTNEYGLEINSRNPAIQASTQIVTECARAAGIHDKIDKKHMLILTTCIDIKTGAYKR